MTLNIARLADDAPSGRRPCRALPKAGVRVSAGPPGNAYLPDLLVTCGPVDDRLLLEAPRLVVEIRSPSTDRYDRLTRLPGSDRPGSVEEIWLVGSTQRLVQVCDRLESGWPTGLPRSGRAAFTSRVLGVAVPRDDVYALTNLA